MSINQPQSGPAKVDWGNPISRGLEFLSIAPGVKPASVGYNKLLSTILTAEIKQKGITTKFNASDYYVVNGNVGQAAEGTVLVMHQSTVLPPNGPTYCHVLASSVSSTPSGGDYFGWLLMLGNGSGALQFRTYDASSSAAVGEADGPTPLNDGLPHISVATWGTAAGSILQTYVDGVPHVTSDPSSGPTTFQRSPWIGAARDAFWGAFEGNQYLVAIWNRRLSADEIAKISSNPWQLFKSNSDSKALLFLITGLTKPVSNFSTIATDAEQSVWAQYSVHNSIVQFNQLAEMPVDNIGNVNNDLAGGANYSSALEIYPHIIAAQYYQSVLATVPFAVNDFLPNNLVAETGVFSLNGQNAGLLESRVLAASQGSYLLLGQDIALRKPTGSVLQKNSAADTSSGSSLSVTLPSAPTVGNYLWVIVISTDAVSTASDTAANTFTDRGSVKEAAINARIRQFTAPIVATASPYTLTVNWATPQTNRFVAVFEIAGVSSFQESDNVTDTGTNPSATASVAGTTQPAFCIAAGVDLQGTTMTIGGNGYTSVGNFTPYAGTLMVVQKKSVNTSGTQTSNFANPGSDRTISSFAVFAEKTPTSGSTLVAAQGSYALNGQIAKLLRNLTLLSNKGDYALLGQIALLTKISKVLAAQGSYSLNGQTVNLTSLRRVVANQGVYSLNGQIANLLRNTRLISAQGVYALNGQAVGLSRAARLTATQGAYSLSGQSVNLLRALRLLSSQGAYSLAGQNAALGTAKRLAVDQGAYALAGQAVAFRRGLRIAAVQGSYAINGQTVGTLLTRRLNIGQGSFTLNGQNANLSRVKVLQAAQGAFSINGQSVAFLYSKAIKADYGSYSINGQSVNFLYSKKLIASQGSYLLNGQTVRLILNTKIPASVGSYVINGQTVRLLVSHRLILNNGAYAINGQDATLIKVGVSTILAQTGFFVLTGQAAILRAARRLAMAQGAYALSGQNVSLYKTVLYRLIAAQGLFNLNGQDANRIYQRKVLANAGLYLVSGQAAALKASRKITAVQGSYVLFGQPTLFNLARKIIAINGNYALSGYAISFRHDFRIYAGSASFVISGQSVVFKYLGGFTISPERTYKVVAENRGYVVAADNRTVDILKDKRNVIIVKEKRSSKS